MGGGADAGSAIYTGGIESLYTGNYHETSSSRHIYFNAANSSPTYWRSDNIVIPRNIAFCYIIKYT